MATELKNIQIYLLDRNAKMCAEWERECAQFENVKIVKSDFGEFMAVNNVECVVSPANSYGLMDGGYDLAITEWFGENLQLNVRRYIIENFYGEQPVGTSFIIDAGRGGAKLIHTPSMRYPSAIRDPLTVYNCTRTCLMCAMQNNVKSVVIPAFGGATGRLGAEIIAKMMRKALEQLSEPPAYINWRYATSQHFKY